MTNQSQIQQCQLPDYTQYSAADLKRMGKQQFCSVCERWQFKSKRCELFKVGVQV